MLSVLNKNFFSDVILLPNQTTIFLSNPQEVLLNSRKPSTAVEAAYQRGAAQPR
jgi:hypothetical protein